MFRKSDELYNRQKVLEQIAEILKDSVPEFKEFNAYNFSAESEKPKGFNVYDLTDVSNKFFYPNDCVNIINNHIYHVYPARYENSLSHIIILENGNLKVFKSINCTDRGDTVEDVIIYLNQKIPDIDENKKQILERVKNYRKYGKYPRIDYSASIYCKTFR